MSTTITLEDDEALVLFELLASERIETDIPELQAPERNALWAFPPCSRRCWCTPYRRITPGFSKKLVHRSLIVSVHDPQQSNNTLNTDRQQAIACGAAPRVRGAGGLAGALCLLRNAWKKPSLCIAQLAPRSWNC
ncbi:MAG: hypothetical protein IRZ28_07560 [Steroidobacteraceae bacterium]|nr:hypothetical protein [Steroidobacteraceae bacterium]